METVQLSLLQEGKKAPDFSVPASNPDFVLLRTKSANANFGFNGKTISLADYKNKKIVILYFYPKDNTPGCTLQACNFRDKIVQFDKTDAVILGVSPDSVASHHKFIEKFKLPFILLADIDHKLCESYGVWVEKNMYGRKYMGVARTTYVIDKEGKILKAFAKVNPLKHINEVLAFLQSL